MTPLSLFFSIFPALVIGSAIATFILFCFAPHPLLILALLFILYGLPLLVHRLHQWRYPIAEGISYLQGTDYSPWWGSHQIQVIYIAFPALETILRLIPGAFSLWLRLWGATVGKNVYWTPTLNISDRSLLTIGDNVVFGHQVGLYAHAVKPRKQNLMLFVKSVTIGSGVFLSGGVQIGPGVTLSSDTFVPLETRIYPNQTVSNSDLSKSEFANPKRSNSEFLNPELFAPESVNSKLFNPESANLKFANSKFAIAPASPHQDHPRS